MTAGDGGRAQSVALLALVVAAVAALALAGLVLAGGDSTDDGRTGEEILADVQATYSGADSVATDAVVTVETDTETTQFEVSTVVAGEDRRWLNLSNSDGYVLVGASGETAWFHDPERGLTGVLEGDERGLTAGLRAGPEALAELGAAGVSGQTGAVDSGEGLSRILDGFGGDLPDDIEGELDGLSGNTTLPDVLGDALDGEGPRHNGSDGSGEFDLPDAFEEWNDSEMGALEPRIRELLTGEFPASEPTVEHVGTTTIDGTEASELLFTHPDGETETRLWTDIERDTLLRQETATPGATVTVDVLETQLDVSPANSTFEPPGVIELASLRLSTAETAATFDAEAPFEITAPDEGWTFERGVVLAGGSEAPADLLGVNLPSAAAATYTDGESSLLVGQFDGTVDLEQLPADTTETVTVGDRTVRLSTAPAGAVGAWNESGTTVLVASDLDGSQLQELIAGIEFERSDT